MKINVKIILNKNKSEVEKIDNNNFKVFLKSIPEKGKANYELISLLSKHLKVTKDSIKIIKGLVTKNKIIEIV